MIAATGQVVAKAHSYHPPGPLFLIFAFGAISSMPHTVADLAPAVLVTSATALFCLAVGIAGGLRHPRAALAGAHWLPLHFQANWQPLWMALAVLISGALAVLLGIGHPYWAMVSAIAPLSAPDVTQQITRGIHRTIGTTGASSPHGCCWPCTWNERRPSWWWRPSSSEPRCWWAATTPWRCCASRPWP